MQALLNRSKSKQTYLMTIKMSSPCLVSLLKLSLLYFLPLFPELSLFLIFFILQFFFFLCSFLLSTIEISINLFYGHAYKRRILVISWNGVAKFFFARGIKIRLKIMQHKLSNLVWFYNFLSVINNIFLEKYLFGFGNLILDFKVMF